MIATVIDSKKVHEVEREAFLDRFITNLSADKINVIESIIAKIPPSKKPTIKEFIEHLLQLMDKDIDKVDASMQIG